MRKDKALEFRRAAQLSAQNATDEEAMTMPSIYPAWSGGGVAYQKDRIVRHGETLYRCITGHTSQGDWSPDAAVSLWVLISDPAVEWPEWVQPTGAHDAYALGAKVSHGGKRWVSTAAANTWEPGTYGWTEQQ